ncbi:MAG: hypothetical protein IPL78_27200 [Chloroflexi bacterium]|nr:hypothetical protein [Chloroflexota bacterium]
MKPMPTPQQHPSQRENIEFAHRAALLTVSLVGSTILLLQVLSGTNPLPYLLRLVQLVGTLYLVLFLLGVLARSTWGDLAPARYGLFFYSQAPANSPVVPYVPEFVIQISHTLLLPLTVRLRHGIRLCSNNVGRCANGSIVIHKTSLPFRLFGQAPLLLPW